jgi:predicted MFS family arabinose efflux permease
MSTPTARLADARNRSWIAPFFAVLFGMMMLQWSNLGFGPLLPDIQSAFDISYGQVGLFTGVYGLIGIVLSVPAGLLARRYGEKSILLAGLIGVICGLLILAVTPSFLVALIGRIVWLSGYRLAFVCVMMAAALTAPPKLKGSTMGIIGATSGLASVGGAPFASELAKVVGWRGGYAGYAVMATIGAVVFGLLYRRVGDAEPSLPHGGGPARRQEGVRPAHKTPVVWVMAVGIGLLNMGGFTITFFVPVVVKGVFHLTATDAALMISSAYIGAIFFNLLCGYLADRFDRLVVMIALSASIIVGAFGLMSTDLLIFRIAVVMMVALGHSATNQGYATVGTVLRGREVGPAMGIVSLGSGVYAYMGPQMLGLLRDWTGGFVAGFQMLAASAALGLVLMIALKIYSSRSAAAEPAVVG